MLRQPAEDVLDDLRKLAGNPYWLSSAEMRALLDRAVEEIEALRLLVAEDAEPEGRA